MIKVCFLVEPLTGKAIVWKQVENMEEPWRMIGKVKVSKTSNWLVISLARVKEIIREEERKEKGKQNILFGKNWT